MFDAPQMLSNLVRTISFPHRSLARATFFISLMYYSMATAAKLVDPESIVRLPSASRGHADLGWLKSYHTFSFADYHNPKMKSFGPLQVINEDSVAAGQGFPSHPHANFEIFSYVLKGSLKHRDSMGNSEVIRRGGVQFTSAGTGIVHSEFNEASTGPPVKFLQVWLRPSQLDLKPSYMNKDFADERKLNALLLIISRDGRDDSIKVHQDADIYASITKAGAEYDFDLPQSRKAYIHVAATEGSLEVNGVTLKGGDGAFIHDSGTLHFKGLIGKCEYLLFDLPLK